MSVTTATDAPMAASCRPVTPSLFARSGTVVLFGFALALVLSWPRLLEIWRDNTFFDTDDAMRLVQVRNWLGGQGWYDLVEHRLHPPAGLLMHWSRVVDVPVGALIRLFEVALPPDPSERLARIVFPLMLQLALIAVTVRLGRLLAGPAAMLPAMTLILTSGFVYEQFPPGRIDHHAPQITLLMAMTGTILSSLTRGRAWHAALAGLCVALSLAISLENLPFMVVIVAVLPLVWLGDPGRSRAPLLWFAAGLALAVPALFGATVAPWRMGTATCDAFSIAHVTFILAGAATLAALAVATPALKGPVVRSLALGLAGVAVAAVMLSTYPACLRDPYADMDPLLRSLWLSHVTEAQPLLAASRARPDTFTILFCPLVVGACGAALAAWRERGVDRARWVAILALCLVGMTGTMWEIRVAASTQPLAVLGGTWVVTRALATARARGSALRTALACLLALPFATMAWAFVPAGDGDAKAAAQLAQGEACRRTTALSPLADLPPGLVLAPIDDGSHLLVDTPLSVVAAPYHRNQAGNRLVLDALRAPPAQAEALVRGASARYVMLCPGEVEITILTGVAPQGLGARLAAGEVPAWLRPVAIPDTPYRVFALVPPVAEAR